MYTAIITLITPYAKKIVTGLIVILVAIGGYFYWKHEVVSAALDARDAEWKERDEETEKKGKAILALKNYEIERIKEEQREVYIGAIHDYANHYKSVNIQLAADRNKRLFVNATKASCGGNALPARAGSATGVSGASAEILQAELEPETADSVRANAAEVEMGARVCEMLIERFLIPNSVLK